ncbi:MAG: hypothetical protein ABJB47_06955, partial [Actinomycetota bacterium]
MITSTGSATVPAGPPAPGPASWASGVPAGARRVQLAWAPSPHARRLLTLGLAGLAIAVATRRPEFAAAAAAALLLLAGWRQDRPWHIAVTAELTARQVTEQESTAARVSVSGHGGYSVSLQVHPADEVTPGSAANGDGDPGGPSQLPFAVTRWGHRPVGALEIVLRDRWRLSEGRAS